MAVAHSYCYKLVTVTNHACLEAPTHHNRKFVLAPMKFKQVYYSYRGLKVDNFIVVMELCISTAVTNAWANVGYEATNIDPWL